MFSANLKSTKIPHFKPTWTGIDIEDILKPRFCEGSFWIWILHLNMHLQRFLPLERRNHEIFQRKRFIWHHQYNIHKKNSPPPFSCIKQSTHIKLNLGCGWRHPYVGVHISSVSTKTCVYHFNVVNDVNDISSFISMKQVLDNEVEKQVKK